MRDKKIDMLFYISMGFLKRWRSYTDESLASGMKDGRFYP
jgi:hypothetical protein